MHIFTNPVTYIIISNGSVGTLHKHVSNYDVVDIVIIFVMYLTIQCIGIQGYYLQVDRNIEMKHLNYGGKGGS